MPETPDEELVRRLLAEARHDEPVPADVVTRLDGVLDELATERRRVAVLRPRAARRRRWAVGLVAAAAVVVGGVATRSMWPTTSDSSSSGSSAADSASGGKNDAAQSPENVPVVVLHLGTLADDVRRAVADLPSPTSSLVPPGQAAAGSSGCAAADWGPGRAVPARLDGRDVVLVLRPMSKGRQRADVLECGTAHVLASVTVPAD